MRSLAAILVLLTAGSSLAEGASQQLDCALVTTCEGNGACNPDEGIVVFALTPTSLDADGTQHLRLSYGEATAAGARSGPMGAIQWHGGDQDRQTLLPAGPDALVWHRLTAGKTVSATSATTLFLSCEAPT